MDNIVNVILHYLGMQEINFQDLPTLQTFENMYVRFKHCTIRNRQEKYLCRGYSKSFNECDHSQEYAS